MEEYISEYCLSKFGVIKEYKPEWEVYRFMIGGKMFAMLGTDKNNVPIFTLKCDPAESIILRNKYKDIIPGYYMNKEHWISIYLEGSVPKEEYAHLIDVGYELIYNSLPKKIKEDIKNV
jgi:predicted DNA-binding protein (MmcQ/YjbR family)